MPGPVAIPALSAFPRRLTFAVSLAIGLLVVEGPAAAQAQPPASSGPATAAGAKPPAPRASAPRPTKASSGSGWKELSAAQQRSLEPLAGQWDSLSEGQKRKWIALARNYPRLKPEEQAKVHSRMTEWVALSPQQRTQARLNFADTKRLSAVDKKAKWEAYQSLSPEEKKKLAARATPKPKGVATAVKPVPPQKLARVGKDRPGAKGQPPAGPASVDHNTLLPQQKPADAAVAPVPTH
ncbi:MAG: DUF3106 domain-containing protein [Ramlibacter sp.]|nr:DUF3106 domain-containing protein [Ramlibacter sp.]